MAAIWKFNKYCDILSQLAELEGGSPTVPCPLTIKLEVLWDDPYLMEDVWVLPMMQVAPLWLTDLKVCKGIHAMLKKDWCGEEQEHLGRDTDNMCWWFGRHLTAIELAIQLNISKSLSFQVVQIHSHCSSTTARCTPTPGAQVPFAPERPVAHITNL